MECEYYNNTNINNNNNINTNTNNNNNQNHNQNQNQFNNKCNNRNNTNCNRRSNKSSRNNQNKYDNLIFMDIDVKPGMCQGVVILNNKTTFCCNLATHYVKNKYNLCKIHKHQKICY